MKRKNGIGSKEAINAAMNKKPDVRLVLKPFVGKEVRVKGTIDKLSTTKGKYPKASALIKDVTVMGEDIELPYLWMITEDFDEGFGYVFTATIIEYVTYDRNKSALTKYGFGNMKHIVKHDGDIDAAVRASDAKKVLTVKSNEANSTHAVKVIENLMTKHNTIVSPIPTEDGEWKAMVSKVGKDGNIELANGKTFASAVMGARDIIEFLCEGK